MIIDFNQAKKRFSKKGKSVLSEQELDAYPLAYKSCSTCKHYNHKGGSPTCLFYPTGSILEVVNKVCTVDDNKAFWYPKQSLFLRIKLFFSRKKT